MQFSVVNLSTQQLGRLAALKVEQRAIDKGFIVSIPTTEARYDMVLDGDGGLKRVQIKYASGKWKNAQGSVRICLRKRHKNTVTVYSKEEIDLVLVYVPSVDKIVRLLPEHFHLKAQFTIRLKRSVNEQVIGTNLLDDFVW